MRPFVSQWEVDNYLDLLEHKRLSDWAIFLLLQILNVFRCCFSIVII